MMTFYHKVSQGTKLVSPILNLNWSCNIWHCTARLSKETRISGVRSQQENYGCSFQVGKCFSCERFRRRTAVHSNRYSPE